jgi:hypothetical protein
MTTSPKGVMPRFGPHDGEDMLFLGMEDCAGDIVEDLWKDVIELECMVVQAFKGCTAERLEMMIAQHHD